MDREKAKQVLEAVLFAMGEAVELSRLAGVIGEEKDVTRELLTEMKEQYRNEERGMDIIELDGAYQMCTRAELYDYLIKIAKNPRKYVLTDSVLETLSIIAYKQPVTKMEIEKIRGVSSDFAVNKLIEYHLVTELGRLNAPGRPLLFGTTEEFLRSFGVRSLDELPELKSEQLAEFQQQAEEEAQLKLDI